MVKRRFLAVLALLLILGSHIFLLTGCTTAEEIPIPKAQANVFVYDDDHLFDESVEGQLNSMLIDLEEKTGAEFAVITVKSLLGKEIETYSITVANSLGIGKKDEDNGVLLLMSRSDKRVRLEIGKGLEGILNDAKCGRILDEYFVPHRNKDEYVEATRLTVQAVINVIAVDAQVTVDGVDSSVTAPEPAKIPWGWIIGGIIAIIIILWIINRFTDGAVGDFLYVIASSSDESSNDGGFGGGFGGGDFGGGGASR